MPTKSHLFRDILSSPGYLQQFDVLRIRKMAEGNTDEDFKEFFACEKSQALEIIGFWEVAQVELWDAEILKRFFHPWIYADRDLVAARIQAAQRAGRLTEHCHAEAALQWLESENVLMGMLPQWVRANTRRRDELASASVKPLSHSEAQNKTILDKIRSLGHDPLKFPKNSPGKPGVKAAVRTALVGIKPFPANGTQFDHAWERLRDRGDIVDQS